MDSIVFDAANKCDLEKLRALFTENLEFFHDGGGPILGKDTCGPENFKGR